MLNLLYNLNFIFIIGPIFEWSVHFLLHKFNNKFHKRHHLMFHNNTKNIEIEKWAVFTFLLFFCNKYYLWSLINLRYLVVHTIIHKCPHLFNDYFKIYVDHHIKHHIKTDCNYGVTSIWVDKLFKTQFIEK